MAIRTATSKQVFVEGRGGPQSLAKSAEEVLHEEAEELEELAEGVSQEGPRANDSGAKPIYATGEELPFHHGRGAGRGHGPETAKNA